MSVLSSKTVFTSSKFNIVQRVIQRKGNTFTKEIIERKSVIVVIPYTEAEIYIQSQYRDGPEKVTLEFVQGTIEEGEDPLETAKRELHEEAGLVAKTWKKLAVWDLNALINMQMYVFAATNLEEKEQKLEFDEEIEIMKMSLEKILKKIDNGEMTVSSHIAAILLFDRLKKEGKW